MQRRNTNTKASILEVLKEYQSPMSYDMIVSRIQQKMDKATVYRVLNRFQEDGLTHKIVGPDGKQYFALCNSCEQQKEQHSHNHLHFQCESCERVECLPEQYTISLPKGYRPKNFNTFITGICSSC